MWPSITLSKQEPNIEFEQIRSKLCYFLANVNFINLKSIRL